MAKNIAKMKINFGIRILKKTSENFAKFLGELQRRFEENRK